MNIHDLLRETGSLEDQILEGDYFDVELDALIIESSVIKVLPDGIVISADETALAYLGINESQNSTKIEAYGYKYDQNDRRIVWRKIFSNVDALNKWADKVNATVIGTRELDDHKDLSEAEYQGRTVSLNKPMSGDVKKSKVYVKGPSGRVVKVNFGDKKMKIKKSNPARRKSFRARHNCANPGPKHKARYWSCRAWE